MMIGLPKQLYRRTARPFAEQFLTSGTVVFRSLAEYRDLEGKKIRIGDKREGGIVSKTTKGLLKIEVGPGEFGAPLKGEFELGAYLKRLHNYFVFCTSLELHEDQNRYGDVLIRINSPGEFLERLKQKSHGIHCGAVQYYVPEAWGVDHSTNGWHPAWIDNFPLWQLKDAELFHNDSEFRFCLNVQEIEENCGLSRVNISFSDDLGTKYYALVQAVEFSLGDLSGIAEILN